MVRKATMLAAAFATFVVSAPVSAQSICGERSRFVEQLGAQYGESLNAVGLISDGALLEVMTSEKGSWTILVTRPNGISCMVASGESWQPLPKLAAAGPGA